PGSEIMSMSHDGSNVTTFAKTWKSGWVEMAEKIVVAEGAVFWSSQQEGEKGSTYNLYRASLAGAHTPKKIATFDGEITALASDGAHVFIGTADGVNFPYKGEIDVAPADGSAAPRTLVAATAHPDNLVYDDRFGLLFTEWSDGVEL